MSLLVELSNHLMNAQSCMGSGADTCPASATTAVAAAWATQGYWVQADILQYLRGETAISVGGSTIQALEGVRDLANIPILLYLLGGIAGFLGIALGMPPKNYMWFFLGPGIFSWLIDTTQPVKGVGWMVAYQPQQQAEVWRLAEVGLRNSGIVKRSPGVQIYASQEPSSTVEVASMFLWLDEVMSGIVQSLSWWTGIYEQSTGSVTTDTNLAGGLGSDGKWFLLSNLKWAMVEDITAARLHNADLRDVFAQFMSSECGDEIAKAVDQPSYIFAAKSRGSGLRNWRDYTVFLHAPGHDFSNPQPNNAAVARLLTNVWIPVPDALRWFFEKDSQDATGTLRDFADFFNSDSPSCAFNQQSEQVNCATLLWIIVHAFRWEAAHVYQSMMERIPNSLRYGGEPYPLEFTLFYGWDIKKNRDNGNWLESGDVLSPPEYQQFLLNLILIHLFRNEMEQAKKPVNLRYASSTEHEDYVETYQARTGAKAKYGEIYSYAMMIPYIQGILLYFLAIAYPFACMMIVFPGWHKIIITWASFWAWAKLWDVGFAFVMMIERSLWAMLGSGSDFAGLATFIVRMKDYGKVNIFESCTMSGCIISEFANAAPDGGALGPCGMQTFDNSLRTFDRALMLGSNLDLDLVNAYYLYFIAALYLAVPAVVGQIVLGAKAGVGGMVGQMFGGTATEGGKAAGEAYKGQFATYGYANLGSASQAGTSKDQRKSGAMLAALEAGNMGADAQLAASSVDAANKQLGAIGQARQQTAQSRESAYVVFQAGVSTLNQGIKEGGQTAMTFGGTMAPAGSSGGGPNVPGGAPGGSGSGGGRTIGNTLGALANAAQGGSGGSGGATAAAASLFSPANVRRAGQLAASVADMGNSLTAAGVSAARHASTNANLADQANINAATAENNLRGFAASAAGSGFNAHAGRMQSAAEYQGAVGGWRARRDLANQMTGIGSAIGVFPGGFAAGDKPVNLQGMAMGGMLNSYGASGNKVGDASGAANYFNPTSGSGYFSNAASAHSSLSSFGGAQGVQNATHLTGLAEATATIPGVAMEGLTSKSMSGNTIASGSPSGGYSSAGHFHYGPDAARASAQQWSGMPFVGGAISGTMNAIAGRLDHAPSGAPMNSVSSVGGNVMNAAYGKR